ncbi:PhoH family protein [Priestia aryabhattai]|uniref:PhoH family protein n=1 Tax=Priestia aryabhattai TaxID=412384 RepID=UPI0015F47457|nr:PhoH family protein [Priestia aryabhattai]
MGKIYVIDTNVILSDSNFLNAFEDNTIVVPSIVLEELDSKKKLMDELGRNARHTSKKIDELRSRGNVHEGVELDNGGKFLVAFPPTQSSVYENYMSKTNDTLIIATAHELAKSAEEKVVLVSKDVLVRVKSDVVGVNAEDYQNDKVISASDDSYMGYTELEVESELINEFYKEKKTISPQPFNENHYVLLKCGNQSAITRYNNGHLNKLRSYTEQNVFGLRHKNLQQIMAFDLLLDEDIPLVTLQGKAGTGKTLLALAAGLELTQEQQLYNKLSVGRSTVPMGNDIGFLPGEKDEKLAPWMQPIYDNLEYLFNVKSKEELNKILSGYEDLINIEALTYIRGRSIPDQYIIIDEAQNLTKHEAKTILTRIGEGCKIILTGDPQQIDHPYLDELSNGFTYVIEKFKPYSLSGHVTLTKGERSDFAQLAADIL